MVSADSLTAAAVDSRHPITVSSCSHQRKTTVGRGSFNHTFTTCASAKSDILSFIFDSSLN